MTLSVQFITMITMVLCGFYLGIIKDTYYRFRPYWKERLILTYLLEICFWLTQTVLLFYVLFRVNGGELRFYIFVACLLGFSIYQALARSIYIKVLERVILMVAAIYRFIARLIQVLFITPIKWIVKAIFTIILFIIHVVGVVLLFLLKILLFPIKGLLKLLYRLLPKRLKKLLYKLAGFYSTMKNITTKWMKYITFKRR
ncbi:spore cortex biosynthesis protein YabQ [Virgibacillus halotolerans]|uniref:spore cortex biosynthesis protein YabQ n=1 Tax=Virgibacillus halotolerans TaxID=1071053 RepID=UPI0019610642|nr:spore cortex biosynthesis protein YabQ [Virgibacillus halotolerans]MBM7601288.1 spore cortex biosynthesis protein YabQ [Virgibacillus halotolerans]